MVPTDLRADSLAAVPPTHHQTSAVSIGNINTSELASQPVCHAILIAVGAWSTPRLTSPVSPEVLPLARSKHNNSIPKTDSNGTLYYENSAIVACKASDEFDLHGTCGTAVCMKFSPLALAFDDAVQYCADRDSSMFIANTLVRWNWFWHVASLHGQNTYLWLARNATDRAFFWGNREPLSDELDTSIRSHARPNNAGSHEDCAEARLSTWPDVYGLNDITCAAENFFICEPNF
ncbi:C-type lectin domain family 17, member a [Plakobranchus ocellatus]|uniref:C-type lectin domain family 17, member a n=1 Tax=Plakobranchus ocellatus TaxID=259542 RepID=A0AAV3YLJ9_9GAST|nr:C-type lectin domain family 17, member a [Plakobranchus ocellatus]